MAECPVVEHTNCGSGRSRRNFFPQQLARSGLQGLTGAGVGLVVLPRVASSITQGNEPWGFSRAFLNTHVRRRLRL